MKEEAAAVEESTYQLSSTEFRVGVGVGEGILTKALRQCPRRSAF